MTEILFQIKTPKFCAGGEIKNRKIIMAAPIIRFMIDWNVDKAFSYCLKRKWNIKSYKYDK